MSKQSLGQFYTTNYKYILQNIEIPDNVGHIIEPFAGHGDLLNFITDKEKYKIECYDIDPKQAYIAKRDTLLNPPRYAEKFVLTNPPYLARNKSSQKEIFNKYDQNDLYKCFIQNLIDDECLGGILIIPLNFWCSIRKGDTDIRENFLRVYYIVALNIFEEKVFDDTSYTICSFQFGKRKNNQNGSIFKCYIYPKGECIDISLSQENNYTIGGEIYSLPQNNNIKIDRLTSKNKGSKYATNLLVKCIDDNEKSMINISYVSNDKIYVDTTPNLSARSYATLSIQPEITQEQQKELAKLFNEYLNTMRRKYNSLFLTNYRESNTIARKRISFSLVFEIVNYLLDKHFEIDV